MKKAIAISSGAAALCLMVTPLLAEPDDDSLVINEELQMVTETEAPDHLEYVNTIYSGWRFRTDETQALQLDDFDNPAMLTVDAAIDAFNTVDGSEGKSCASCHAGPEDFAGLTASMPKVIDGKLVVMEDLLNNHRAKAMGAEPWKWSGQEMQGMVALIGLQSRGMPVDVAIDGEAARTPTDDWRAARTRQSGLAGVTGDAV
jgi:sulfur-oxidizing protein SoxA